MKLPGKKLRTTAIRTALLDILSAAHKPMSAKEIGEQLRKRGVPANKTTIYRDLDAFLAQQLITELTLGDEQKRFELTAQGHHHHLICKKCDRIEDVQLSRELAAEEDRIMRLTRFKITQHSLEFYGLCARCQ